MDETPNENKPSDSPAAAEEAGASKSLTKEEQMAAFEKAMKEEDWGHQPC